MYRARKEEGKEGRGKQWRGKERDRRGVREKGEKGGKWENWEVIICTCTGMYNYIHCSCTCTCTVGSHLFQGKVLLLCILRACPHKAIYTL